jgi:predicted alpha/beta-fold hydrolase
MSPSVVDARFRPSAWLAGGHRQTLLGYWHRRRLQWPLPTEDLVVDAGDDVRILARASWQPGPREERPALVLLHGLGGSDQSPYLLSTGALAYARGWHVVRMNMRGAGDGEALCARLYNAGLDSDLLAVLETVSRIVPRIAIGGFSLGANIALLLLGRRRDRLPPGLGAVAAVSPPLDLAACAAALERWDNRPYQHYFMAKLREGYRSRQLRRPDLFPAGRERGLRTVRDFDDRITAPHGGFASADEYYAKSSGGPWLTAIDRPALIVAAEDDPLIPGESVAHWPLSTSVAREMVPSGGHVGFVGASPAPGRFWAALRALDFLEEASGLELMTPVSIRTPVSQGLR